MSAWVPVALAVAAAVVLVAVPAPGAARLASLQVREAEEGRRAVRSRPVTGLRRGACPPGPVAGLRWGAVPAWPVAVALACFVVLGPAAALLGFLGCVAVQRAVRAQRERAAVARERARALEALTVVAGDLRAGRPPMQALSAAAEVAVGGTAVVLATAAAVARVGGDVPAALRGGTPAVPSALRALAACWSVCTVAGSGLATGVERLVEGLRAEEAQRLAVEAELAGPRATAVLLAGLPVAGVGLAAALGADPLRVLLHTPVGVACLLGGLALDVAGLLWTRRLVAGATG